MKNVWIKGGLVDEETIRAAEREMDVSFPYDFREFVKLNNYARPVRDAFDSETSKEHVMNRLLSFNKGDIENIYDAKKVVSDFDITLFPFANDPFGNFICFKDGRVVYWLHENNIIEPVANSFTDFLEMLYD